VPPCACHRVRATVESLSVRPAELFLAVKLSLGSI